MKIFIIGHGPLPDEPNVQCQTAFGLRTWQFLSLAKDVEAEFFVILLSDPKHYTSPPNFYTTEAFVAFGKKISLLRVEKNHPKTKKISKDSYKNFAPDVCFGVNLPAAYQAAKLKPAVPFWADLNGWAMTEGQSQAWSEKNNGYLPFLWQQEKTVLEVADKISTVSDPQKYATYGELATIGRLNSFNDEYDLVTTIPNANEIKRHGHSELVSATIADKQKISLRDKLKISKDSFIVFFSGAYNTWLDSQTMFNGVEAAIKQNQKIYFVSTGGAASVSNQSLQLFKSLIAKSQYKQHFHFLGWVTTAELHACYAQVNLGINIDRPNHETTFGARNRINEWVTFGVPILSTIRSEVSKELAENNGIIGIECGDTNDLERKILAASQNPSELKIRAENAYHYAQKHWSYDATMLPVKNWLQHPTKSSDSGKKICFTKATLWHKTYFHLQKDGIMTLLKRIIKK